MALSFYRLTSAFYRVLLTSQFRLTQAHRVSAAVNPANNATFPIGSIVVQSVAKSLLILIKSGDICRSVCFILIRMRYQARAKLLRSASLAIERVNDLSDSRFLVTP